MNRTGLTTTSRFSPKSSASTCWPHASWVASLFSAADRIEIFPVNYATDRAIVVFRTAPGTMLDTVTTSKVAFEVDDWDED